ncbi:hypothetical protein ACFLYX_04105 [Chloroflexota bacterium]
MNVLKGIFERFWASGSIIIGGFLLIIYIAFGILYVQQGIEQKSTQKKVDQVNAVLVRPLATAEELEAKVAAINDALKPIKGTEAVAVIVSIAQLSGIDVSVESGKLQVSPVSDGQFKSVKLGGGNFQVLSINNIRLQGSRDNIMAFLSDLDAGTTLENMVLKKVSIVEVDVPYTGEEGVRRGEFERVMTAVEALLADNDLQEIPNPTSFIDGEANNIMGDDPDTEGITEGFPDAVTTAEEKGYTGTDTPRAGYVLYQHDLISTDNTTQFETVDYISVLKTIYFYTCEVDGTVRQFDGANLSSAREYFGSEGVAVELVATVDVDIYTK